MEPCQQEEVVALLARPQAFGLEEGAVERIDTHISSVFLCGSRVLKMKRAVRLPFLDFTTLEARRNACEAEVALNRRTAPGLYRGLVTVNRAADGTLAIGGDGPAVEWLVSMNRFPQEALFDRMLEAGRLNRDHMLELARAIADFHRRAEPRSDQGGSAGLAWTIATNAESMAGFIPAIFSRTEVDALADASRRALAGVADLLERRRADGFVRFCHGDLHLRNICLYHGHPTPYDAIDFSEPIACIDVFYDLAFLLMDLDQAGSRVFAGYLFNQYLELTGDLGALPALPLFLSCRAGIRAHVAAAMGRPEEARRYLAKAFDYLRPDEPRLLAFGGLSGSGKSRMAREVGARLGAAPGAVVVRTDVLRKRLLGVDPLTHLDADGYTPDVTERTYAALYVEVAQVLAAGRPVVADAVFAKPEQRTAIAAVARRLGVPFEGVWLEASPEVMRRRIKARKRNASDATVAVLEQQMRYDLGVMEWRRMDTSGSKEHSLASVLDALEV